MPAPRFAPVFVLLAAAGVSAADPAAAIKSPAERASWDAIAARFDGPPVFEAKGKTAALRVDNRKGTSPPSGTASVTLDAAGHVVNVTSNVAHFINDEFKLFAAFPELASLTLWHNGKIDPKAKTSESDGTGLAHLAGLPKLTKVTLAGGALNDAGMAAATKLPALTELHIWHSSFTDAGVAAFRDHPRLEVIKIGPMWNPDLTDKSLEALAGCPKLRHVQFAEMYLTWDGGLKHLAKLPAVTTVELKNCLIEPADVEKLKGALPKAAVTWDGLAGAGATLAASAYSRGKSEKWMPKDLLARAAAEAAKAPPAKK